MQFEMPKPPTANPKLLEDSSIWQCAFSRDISEGGILLLTKSCIPLGTRVRVHIPIHDLEVEVSVVGQVVRCEPDEMGFNVALQFLNPNPDDSAIIARYVASN
jgi:hypothetical protein